MRIMMNHTFMERHYTQAGNWYYYDAKYPKAERNRYEVAGTVATLIVVRRDGTECRATFDAADLPKVKRRLWRVQSSPGQKSYILSGKPTAATFLGRYLMDTGDGDECHFISGNTLDHRRTNLVNQRKYTACAGNGPNLGRRWKPLDGATVQLMEHLRGRCPLDFCE